MTLLAALPNVHVKLSSPTYTLKVRGAAATMKVTGVVVQRVQSRLPSLLRLLQTARCCVVLFALCLRVPLL